MSACNSSGVSIITTSAHLAARDDVDHLDAFGFGLLGGGRAGAQRDRDILDAAVAHVEHMGVALAAIADDRDFLALDEIEIGITIVIDAHVSVLRWRFQTLFWNWRRIKPGARPGCWAFLREKPDCDQAAKRGRRAAHGRSAKASPSRVRR